MNPPYGFILEVDDRSKSIKVAFKNREFIARKENLIKITNLLLRQIDDSPTTGTDENQLKFLHYLTRVSMGLADDTIKLIEPAEGSKDKVESEPHLVVGKESLQIPEAARKSKWWETTLSCFPFLESQRMSVSMASPLIAKQSSVSDKEAVAALGSPVQTVENRRNPGEVKRKRLPPPEEKSAELQERRQLSAAETRKGNEEMNAIKKKFENLKIDETLFSKFQHFLNFNSDIDKALDDIKRDDKLNEPFIKLLKSSDEEFFVELREYILNRPDNPLDSDLDLKVAAAIGVLVTSQKPKEGSSDKTFEHSYEAREQAVNFLCSRGEDNKYEIKDEYKQDKDKDIDTALLQLGIECFKDDEDELFTKSPSFKGFKDFENSIKPILSFFPPLQTALSALGPLLLGERELSGAIHGIRFRPSDYSTKTAVEKIEKTSRILLK